jgi:hypothetical protein
MLAQDMRLNLEKALVNDANWCGCVDGALTKENYLDSIKKAGFTNIEILDEKLYMGLNEGKDIEKQER